MDTSPSISNYMTGSIVKQNIRNLKLIVGIIEQNFNIKSLTYRHRPVLVQSKS